MFKRILFGMVLVLSFCLIFAFGTGYAKSEKTDDKDKDGKVTICHYPSGDKEKGQTLSISSKAAEKHVEEHGDTYGACSGESEIEKKLKSWREFWK